MSQLRGLEEPRMLTFGYERALYRFTGRYCQDN